MLFVASELAQQEERAQVTTYFGNCLALASKQIKDKETLARCKEQLNPAVSSCSLQPAQRVAIAQTFHDHFHPSYKMRVRFVDDAIKQAAQEDGKKVSSDAMYQQLVARFYGQRHCFILETNTILLLGGLSALGGSFVRYLVSYLRPPKPSTSTHHSDGMEEADHATPTEQATQVEE